MLSLSGLTNPNPQVRIGPAQKSCMLGLGLRLACTWNHSHGGLLGGFALMFLQLSDFKSRSGNPDVAFWSTIVGQIDRILQ